MDLKHMGIDLAVKILNQYEFDMAESHYFNESPITIMPVKCLYCKELALSSEMVRVCNEVGGRHFLHLECYNALNNIMMIC